MRRGLTRGVRKRDSLVGNLLLFVRAADSRVVLTIAKLLVTEKSQKFNTMLFFNDESTAAAMHPYYIAVGQKYFTDKHIIASRIVFLQL